MQRSSRCIAVAALVSTTLVFGAFAQGGKDSASGSSESSSSKKPIKLTCLVDNQTSRAGMEAVAAAVEKKFGISLTFDLRPGGAEGDNIVKTRLVAGDMDDLNFYNSGSLFLALNPSKQFVDLTDEPYQDSVIDSFKSTVSVNNRVYAVPGATIVAGGWFYNENVYAELGLKVPKTWNELMENCEKIKASGKVPVIASYKDSWTAQLLVLADFYNVLVSAPNFATDYTAHVAGYATTPAALRGFEKLQEVYTRGFLNKDPLATTYDVALQMLANGEGAHYPMLSFAFSNLRASAQDKANDIGFFAQPGDSAEKNGLTVWMPSGISVYKGSKNIKAAKKWLSFYVSKEGLDAYMSGEKPNGPFAIKGIKLPDDILPGVKDILPYIDSGKTAPALEFLSPIKGPNLPQICVQTGVALKPVLENAKEYDKDVEKQAKQLALPGW